MAIQMTSGTADFFLGVQRQVEHVLQERILYRACTMLNLAHGQCPPQPRPQARSLFPSSPRVTACPRPADNPPAYASRWLLYEKSVSRPQRKSLRESFGNASEMLRKCFGSDVPGMLAGQCETLLAHIRRGLVRTTNPLLPECMLYWAQK